MSRLEPRVLIADSDESSCASMLRMLEEFKLNLQLARDEATLLDELDRHQYAALLVDLSLAGAEPLNLLGKICERFTELSVVVVTEAGMASLGVEAVRVGATDFLCRPFEEEEVKYIMQKTLYSVEFKPPEPPKSGLHAPRSAIIGSSPIMVELERTLSRVADGVATVLIRGESGTGKELVARRIHEQSPRASGPFIKVHCGALPDNLLESELFGYERGAFTGAIQRKPGRVELAEGGTLFLDEIGDISPAIQIKLLRVLQEREYERLGGTQTLKADVRFLAATHRDLDSLVRSGDYREDLFYRLSVVPIFVPPLRARPEDIAELAMHFARTMGLANGRGGMGIDAPALELLQRHRWPGNVRQLQNFIERLVLLADGPRITARDALAWQPAMQDELTEPRGPTKPIEAQASLNAPGLAAGSAEELAAGGVQTLAVAVANAEKAALRVALQKASGNRQAAARMLGVSPRTLYYKLNEYGLN